MLAALIDAGVLEKERKARTKVKETKEKTRLALLHSINYFSSSSQHHLLLFVIVPFFFQSLKKKKCVPPFYHRMVVVDDRHLKF